MAVDTEPTVDESRYDIQAMILYGFKRLQVVRYVFLRIEDAAETRRYLGAVLPQVSTAVKQHGKTEALQIAFTHAGLTALQLGQDTLGTFSTEFQEGMAKNTMSRVLGDTDDSDPEKWDFGGPKTDPVHVMVALFALDQTALDALHAAQRALWKGAMIEVHSEDGGRLPQDKEHFNFHDSISEPYIRGSGEPQPPGQDTVEPGEIVLAHTDGYGQPARSPTTRAANDPEGLLAISVMYPSRRDLGRNGTYLAFRKLEQDVPGFWNFWRANAETAEETIWLASKAVGRWPSGAPLALTPDRDDPEFTKPDVINNFLYLDKDPEGYGCPVLSHIRRTNPRDSVPITPEISLTETSRHRIIRRGFSYGPFLDYVKENDDGRLKADNVRRGLLFIAINGDLLRQFVFLQQTWANNAGFQGGINQKDPVIGDSDGTNVMEIPRNPARRRISNVPRFVQMKGGAFFFLPSISALRYLAWGGK
ncbi:MAG TPA: Dyp-type peroxidase [Thermoanaerobaculia bacterium]|nr:Dyp-type peroxidase [Thermoanaerobaculia bacterium]